MEYTIVQTADDARQIIALQAQNLGAAVNAAEQKEQGFVTVQHSFDLLWEMNRQAPSIIAKSGNTLAGYALVMPTSFRGAVPILDPMFDMIDGLQYKGRQLSEYRYFVMGQICVAKDWRGQGVFDELYAQMRKRLQGQYDLVVTEIATRNLRSQRAHERVGFERICNYHAPDGEQWDIVVWHWDEQAALISSIAF